MFEQNVDSLREKDNSPRTPKQKDDFKSIYSRINLLRLELIDNYKKIRKLDPKKDKTELQKNLFDLNIQKNYFNDTELFSCQKNLHIEEEVQKINILCCAISRFFKQIDMEIKTRGGLDHIEQYLTNKHFNIDSRRESYIDTASETLVTQSDWDPLDPTDQQIFLNDLSNFGDNQQQHNCETENNEDLIEYSLPTNMANYNSISSGISGSDIKDPILINMYSSGQEKIIRADKGADLLLEINELNNIDKLFGQKLFEANDVIDKIEKNCVVTENNLKIANSELREAYKYESENRFRLIKATLTGIGTGIGQVFAGPIGCLAGGAGGFFAGRELLKKAKKKNNEQIDKVQNDK